MHLVCVVETVQDSKDPEKVVEAVVVVIVLQGRGEEWNGVATGPREGSGRRGRMRMDVGGDAIVVVCVKERGGANKPVRVASVPQRHEYPPAPQNSVGAQKQGAQQDRGDITQSVLDGVTVDGCHGHRRYEAVVLLVDGSAEIMGVCVCVYRCEVISRRKEGDEEEPEIEQTQERGTLTRTEASSGTDGVYNKTRTQ